MIVVVYQRYIIILIIIVFLSVKDEYPSMDTYDHYHPAVVFTVLKWYMDPEDIAQMLIDQYPNNNDNNNNNNNSDRLCLCY